MARALGDSRRRPRGGPPSPGARGDSRRFRAIAWQLVWQGLRVEAEASEPAPDRVAALAALSGELPATTPPALAYRALADGEVGRTAGASRTGRRRSRPAGGPEDPYLVAYALLRRPRSRAAAADREAAAPALQEAARLAAALGAAPLLDDVRALARRARLRIDEDAPAAQTAGPGSTRSA